MKISFILLYHNVYLISVISMQYKQTAGL